MSMCKHESYSKPDSYCPECDESWGVVERDIRIAKLEQQLVKRDYENYLLNEDLTTERKQLAALREAVQTMRERVRQRNGGLIVVGAEEYDALAALLQKSSDE